MGPYIQCICRIILDIASISWLWLSIDRIIDYIDYVLTGYVVYTIYDRIEYTIYAPRLDNMNDVLCEIVLFQYTFTNAYFWKRMAVFLLVLLTNTIFYISYTNTLVLLNTVVFAC